MEQPNNDWGANDIPLGRTLARSPPGWHYPLSRLTQSGIASNWGESGAPQTPRVQAELVLWNQDGEQNRREGKRLIGRMDLFNRQDAPRKAVMGKKSTERVEFEDRQLGNDLEPGSVIFKNMSSQNGLMGTSPGFDLASRSCNFSP